MYERFIEGLDILLNVAIVLGIALGVLVVFFFLMYALGWVWTIIVGLYGMAKDKIEERKALLQDKG